MSLPPVAEGKVPTGTRGMTDAQRGTTINELAGQQSVMDIVSGRSYCNLHFHIPAMQELHTSWAHTRV